MIAVESSETAALEHAQSTRYYRPELDVVRFFAFGSVFIHHMLPRDVSLERGGLILGHLSPNAKMAVAATSNAFSFGLPLFFTLSAYLIGNLLLREKERYGTVNLRAFYLRRILRIWPLYFFGLTIAGAIAVLVVKRPRDLMLFAAFALMVGNWLSMFWHTSNPMLPLWSISVEEQFYLFCPVTVKRLSRRGLYVFSWSLIVLSDAILYIMGEFHAKADGTLWCNSLVQFQMFGAGLILCLWMQKRKPILHMWERGLFLAGGFACWLVACFVFGARLAPAKSGFSMVAGYTTGACGCLLIIAAMLDVHSRLLPRWMIWLGQISFGLYVYHELATWMILSLLIGIHGIEHFLLCFLGSAALTVLLAGLSYRFLERPFLRMKVRFELVPSRPWNN